MSICGKGGHIKIGDWPAIPILDWEPIAYKAEELEFLEIRDGQIDQCAKMLGIPSALVVGKSPVYAIYGVLEFEWKVTEICDELLRRYAPTCCDCGGRHATLEGKLFCYWMRH